MAMPDGVNGRCFGDGIAIYEEYHDAEWGVPVRGDRELYERFCLEAFQSGLAWITILRKRQGFRGAFADFDPAAVARFTEDDVTRLLGDTGIVRNRAKIEASITNARAVLGLWDTGRTLTDLVWTHAPALQVRVPRAATFADVPSQTAESVALARELRSVGFRFVGPTTAYAAMQACGLVDDHLATCPAVAAEHGN